MVNFVGKLGLPQITL